MINLKKLPSAIQFALFVGAASLVSGNALAQDDEDGAEEEATTLDRIQVTGSRLSRADIEGASPVIVIDREDIDASGDVSVADVLRDSTFASFGNFKPQSGSSAQSLATIDLRGLGSGRTLVLIDGRRAPTAPQAASSGTDLNSIPLAAVERIEILSDGASAVYGSDAIGGVVNIILRKDFNGVEMRYGIQQTEVTGGDLEEASIAFGVSSDRGSLVGGAGYSDREIVFTRDQIGYAPGASVYGNNYYDWDYDGAAGPDDGGPAITPGYACNDPGFFPTSNGLCSYDFNAVAANEASVNNKSLFLLGDYQINDDWSVYSNATVSKVNSFGRYAPAPGVVYVEDGTPQDINFGVRCRDSAGADADGFCTSGSDGLGTYYFHRFAAGGNRDDTVSAINTDLLVGFEGQLTDTIGVDFGIRRTKYEVGTRGNGYVVADLAAQAATRGDYDFADPYGASEETLKGFTTTISRDSQWKTDELYGLVHFDLFEMGGGISNAVVGAEYREDTFFDNYDSLSEAGAVIGSAGNSSGGDRTVGAAYFEWLFPFTTTFDVTLAGRYDRYSDYGNDFSPKISARWQPLDELTLRASYGQGFRAPPLDILSQKTTFSAEPVFDPPSCLAVGSPSTCEIQVDTFIVANPDLSSEQSTQYSVGAVWAPVDWLDLSADYYNIEIEDLISFIGPQTLINRTNDPSLGSIPPGLSVTRNPNNDRITEVIAGYANEGLLETDGIDFRANTDFDLGGMGRLQNRLTISWVNEYNITNAAGITTEYIGLMGQPQERANLMNIWSQGDWTFIFNTNYIGGQEDSTGQVGGYATNDLQVSWEAPWNASIAVGATNIGDRYPELVPYDGRTWNFYLYDAYGRTTYLRYTQRF